MYALQLINNWNRLYRSISKSFITNIQINLLYK